MKTLSQISESARREKQLKVVFFGLGSIGSRLARLVRDNFSHKLFAFRSTRNNPNDLGVNEIYELEEIERLSPDIAFITNPTSFHMETAIQSASMGMHLFVEKPFSNSLNKLDILERIIQDNNLLTYVGLDLRFDPIIQHLKKTLEINELFYARIICSSYLPKWRTGRDYRDIYSAKKDLGGGVILDLIHEMDYCSWLFGPFEKIEGNAGRISNLQIETEDFADMTLNHSNGFVSQVHLDYFGSEPQRKLEIFGNDIYIETDLLKRKVTTTKGKVKDIKKFESLGADYTFLEELKYFFHCLNVSKNPMNNINEHISVLIPVLELKKNIGL